MIFRSSWEKWGMGWPGVGGDGRMEGWWAEVVGGELGGVRVEEKRRKGE